jgi:glutamate racemase
MEDVRKIGLFDSGLGGLTVLRALDAVLPEVPKIYFGDTLHLPYGDKSDDAIINYSTQIVEFLWNQGCDLIVIACNSASAAAGAVLEERFPELRFVNVIDPVVEALASGSSSKVGLLGTRATIRSAAYPKRLEAINPQIELKSLTTPLLVPLIEDGFLGTGIEEQVLGHYLGDPSLKGIEALVPGCTHYPLLQEVAMKLLKNVQWIDAPAIVAQTVVSHWDGPTEGSGGTSFFLSDRTESFLELASKTFGIQADWQTVQML